MIIEIFGWIIHLRAYKKVHEKPNKSLASLLKEGPKLSFDGRYFYLCESDGYPIKNQISCIIEDEVNELTKATITVHISGMTEHKQRPINND